MRSNGFTLIELLVAISIIAVLSVIGLSAYQSVYKSGRDSKRQSDLRSIQSALEQYFADQLFYPDAPLPSAGNPLTSNTGNPSPNPSPKTYLNSVPSDPDPAKSYCYAKVGSSYELCAELDNAPSLGSGCSAVCSSYNFKVTPP